jgi:hypothetical protein
MNKGATGIRQTSPACGACRSIPANLQNRQKRSTVSAERIDSLIKFTDRAGALHILSEQKLRWSAPDLFADPFELSSLSELNFDVDSLLDSTIKLASSMIFAPEQPKGDSPLISAIRRWREEDRFNSPEEAHGVLRELLSKMVDYRQVQLRVAMAKWQEYVRQVRICAFSAKPDNVTAWELFGENHKGVAIRLVPGQTEPFASAKAVVYQTERPQLTSLREQLGSILHNRRDTMVERFKDHWFVKGTHRKLEQELRCVQMSTQDISIEDTDSKNWYEDLPFPAELVTGVFFGLRTDEETKNLLIKVVRERYQSAKIFQAVAGKVGYTLEFEKIHSN